MSDFTIDRERILVGKSHPHRVTCSIDTVRASTSKKVKIDERVINALKAKSIKLFRAPGWRLDYSDSDKSIWFNHYRDGTIIFEMNFSDHATGWAALDCLKNELGPWALNAVISRADANLTFPLPPRDVFHGLDFGKKRSCERWGCKSTGESFYIGIKGRKHEMIVYDKRKESRAEKNKGKSPIKHPCTRIEINSLPKAKMRVRELSLFLTHRPFKHVTRYKVTLIPPQMSFDEGIHTYLRRLGRFHEFKARYEDWGFHLARRRIAIETLRNFHFHYGEFYSREKVEPSLDDIFQIGIRGFFPKSTKEQTSSGGAGAPVRTRIECAALDHGGAPPSQSTYELKGE